VYGYARSIWAVIDTRTREPVDLKTIHEDDILQYINKDKVCPITKPSRVQVKDDTVKVRTVNTYYSDVDVNGHINSIRYIDHILDLFDLDYYRRNTLKRFEIAYVAESHQGDQLNIYRKDEGEGIYSFKVTKTEPMSSKEIEVVRSKATFIKK
jgi:acyl-ACP thioesterase